MAIEDIRILRDIDCIIDTPVTLGRPKRNIYGQGLHIVPQYPGKYESKHDQRIYLPNLLPLEDYDLIILLFSGGKDSTAAFYSLIEMGVPREKIQLWNHDLDGGHPSRIMDWPVTAPYVQSFAEAEGVHLQISQRTNGFWGEVYRIGSPYPIEYELDGQMVVCPTTKNQAQSEALRREIMESLDETELPEDSAALSRLWCSKYEELLLDEMLSHDLQDLGRFGYVGKFPAKSSISNGRWCSSKCKKEVSDTVIRDIYSLKEKGGFVRFPLKTTIPGGRYCSSTTKEKVFSALMRNLYGLKEQGGHLRLPAKSSLQNGRYCTSVGKDKVFIKIVRHHQDTKEGIKILVVSGERRGESANRSKYNEIELSPCNATARGNRLVHHWRMVIDYTERDIWEVIRRHHCVPHPCYALGWNRCSCAYDQKLFMLS